ncbi:beta-ketoacyl-[acyl-carrier-protein] synthase family protein [Edaphobacter albus]|uniref:beta-ketoacyl-[acyl-carrier-protein] synthase family protein n=1 Tax=Edaphobacter sp. 4G125 TaxID=2763071 RepID=UPI0016462779|nr:beta-ketoacyl-[acyl-carrier-protein] synthase family protein [Edaphobacter sp. 4G125]QNI36479.1 beta-ketoacyl-[acyl-carrier-protein] synthase family protein [Edaphobacter sp. 4G125]
MNRVVITGLGCITPIGSTVDLFRDSLFAGKTGIAPIAAVPDAPEGDPGVRYSQAAQIFDFDPAQHLDSGIITATNRNTQLAIVAARQAARQASLTEHHAPENIAIIMGCACGGRSSEESEVKKLYLANARAHPLTIVRTMSSAGASNISIDLRITGPTLDISTACASATHAIGMAFHMVRSGMTTAAIAGGHEAPLSWGFYRAWDSMRVVSPTRCRPFAADRDGMTLGEGAAMLVLETLESAQERNAPIFAEIVGFGMSADANHITQPQADGAATAMRKALADANISPGEVGYINAHGTGTQANDSTEAAAIHQVFGARAAKIPISSTKALHGHSIGASGALEALATTLALQEGKLPQNGDVTNPDPSLNLDIIINGPRPTGATIALSNSLAFGGLNAVIALRTWQ